MPYIRKSGLIALKSVPFSFNWDKIKFLKYIIAAMIHFSLQGLFSPTVNNWQYITVHLMI